MKKRNFGYLLIFLGLLMFCGSATIHIFNEKQEFYFIFFKTKTLAPKLQ